MSGYSYKVETKGIRLMLSTGEERYICYSEITKFCNRFNDTQSFKTGTYHDQFNKSYLLPIAKAFEITEISFNLPEEVCDPENFIEGAVRNISVNAYERNPQARISCINHYGAKCIICSFDFGATFGDFAESFIHVHHIYPLSDIKSEYNVDPILDLRPVCPNCHAVIHMRGVCLSLDEVKTLINSKK